MEHKNFTYSIKSRYNGTVYYICSHFRSAGCPACLIVKSSGTVEEVNTHSCLRPEAEAVVEATEEMREVLESLATSDMALAPARVWKGAVAFLRRKHGEEATLRYMPRQVAVSFVKNVRKELTGGDVFRAIELEPTVFVSPDDERPFLQFRYVYAHAGVIKRMIGFAHPDLLRLLKYPKNPLFIDCTFKVCPRPFSQVAIVMGYDPAYDLYLPIFYALLPDKQQDTYWHLLDNVIMQCDLQIDPRYVTCDFELGLLGAVRQQFAGVSIVGCLFHWKQALRRKLIDLRIPKEIVSDVMATGVIDVLTVIPISEITEKGIPFVRSRIDESGHRVKWDTFWRYFKRTWMRNYDPAIWNVNAIAETTDIVNRTNNARERFNRELNASFTTAHPNLLAFMAVVKEKSKSYVELLEDIRHNRQQPPEHGNLVRVTIPVAYRHFCEEQDRN